VYQHYRTRHKVVVKKFQRRSQEDLFQREFQALVQLWHPCVVPLYGAVLRAGKKAARLATYFMDGGSLAAVLRRHPSWLTPTAKSIIIVGIVLGMIHVHEHGFMHRDLKPSNILLDAEHRPRICDFGSNRHEQVFQTMTGLVGTRNYSAPEISGKEDYTNKVDVYSFVLLMYEVIVERPVFPPDLGQIELAQRMMNADATEIPASVSEFAQNVMRRAWSPDPAERPSFRKIFKEMRANRFEIMNGVDTVEVESYVDWVRKCQNT
jgi:serine/threonine protein kinase